MKKRILAVVMMMIMVLASAMSVSAANSRKEPVYPSGSSIKKYETSTDEDTFKDLTKEIQDVIKELNDDKVTSLSKDLQKTLEGKKLITDVFDLWPVGDHTDCHGRHYHEVEITVDALTDKCKDVVVVYYTGTEWKTATIVKIDGNKITAKYEGLLDEGSPVGIYANVSAGTGTGTSPSTEGVSSVWMLWTAMALIVLGAGVVVSQKKRG